MKVGTQEWIDFWADWHLKLAQKFSRLTYATDEHSMWWELFLWQEWKEKEVWA